MAPRNSRARDSHGDRRRPRSSDHVLPSITSIPKARQRLEETRRKPDPGAERRREATVQDYLANYERWKAEEAAEKESWDPLFFEDRLKENTQRLMQELEQEQVHALLLDHTKFTNHIRAACRAWPCYEEEAGTTISRTINDPYRNFAVQNDWRKSKHYYHVQCLHRMVDLASLTHSIFFISGERPGSWSLLVLQWFKHQGCIVVDQVITWFKDDEDFKESQRQNCAWKHEHETCNGDRAGCECPPEPERRKKPVLEDYAGTQKESCNLLDVLSHPRNEDIEDSWSSVLHNVSPSSLEITTPQ